MEAFQVQNGNPTSSDLNEAGFLERAFNQIYSGTLDAEHLSEEFLCQPDIVAPKSLSALKQPSRGAIFHLMERLTGCRSAFSETSPRRCANADIRNQRGVG